MAIGTTSPRSTTPQTSLLAGSSNHATVHAPSEYGATNHDIIHATAPAVGEWEPDEHKTTFAQTYIHLLKGYIGCGVLSLPWAVSQLGIPGGCAGILLMAYWSSYNCWTVVKLKRYMERTAPPFVPAVMPAASAMDDAASDVPSGSVLSNASTNITYPDLGNWAYGQQFHNYVTACVCTQQLAICTVFISFIGENVQALLLWRHVHVSHVVVMSCVLPVVLSVSFMPSLKSLAPVMAAGTILMLIAFASLTVTGRMEWEHRPLAPPHLNPPSMPLAACAILYSYEGICLVLPVESAMQEPQHFKLAFTAAMSTVACLLATVASLSVLAFGNVTNGSVTAFLLEAYRNDPSVTFWLMISNAAVSLSVLLTYPLQLFPALELLGPWLQETMSKLPLIGTKSEGEEEADLTGFEPLPPLPEHDLASMGSLPNQHNYEDLDLDVDDGANKDDEDNDDRSVFAMSSVTSMFPEMTMPGDSPQLRLVLVVLTYFVAVAVPNVQSLISLAGAVAGSSTALLIPPVLELAWIRHLQRDSSKEEMDAIDETRWLIARCGADKFLLEKAKSWFLLVMGGIFTVIGSVASISDIVRIYLKK